jgi:hypothetical protein
VPFVSAFDYGGWAGQTGDEQNRRRGWVGCHTMHTNDSGFGVRAERTSGRLDDARRASDATRWRAWFAAVAFVQADECGFGTVGSDSQRSISRARSCVHQLVSCSKKGQAILLREDGQQRSSGLVYADAHMQAQVFHTSAVRHRRRTSLEASAPCGGNNNNNNEERHASTGCS